MGKALAVKGKREKCFLMTKNCGRDAKTVKQHLEDSLRRLKTDHLDLWQFHEIVYDNDPDWIALDLLSQAEHDESAQSILVTDSPAFGQAVAQAVAMRLETLERRAIAGASWAQHGAVIITRDLAEAATLSNRVAPEHLELCTADPEALSRQITHAGAIFLGRHAPEALGDYVAGPSHVLPTCGSARFASGPSPSDRATSSTYARVTTRGGRSGSGK